MSVISLVIETPESMGELGATLAAELVAGDLVLLNGELGAGKTTLTRGIGVALGVRGAVTSPTFVLARTHPRERGAPLVHVDAYRLGSAVELDDLDIDRPHGGDMEAEVEPRQVRVTGHGPRWAQLGWLDAARH